MDTLFQLVDVLYFMCLLFLCLPLANVGKVSQLIRMAALSSPSAEGWAEAMIVRGDIIGAMQS